MNERPILGTERQAQALGQLLRKRIVGGPGIDVRDSPESTVISLAQRIREEGIGGAPGGLITVKVKSDGGDAGSESTQCTWTYAIWAVSDYDKTDKVLAEKQTPLLRRTKYGRYTKAADGSFGLAIILPGGDSKPTYKLAIAYDECPEVTVCD